MGPTLQSRTVPSRKPRARNDSELLLKSPPPAPVPSCPWSLIVSCVAPSPFRVLAVSAPFLPGAGRALPLNCCPSPKDDAPRLLLPKGAPASASSVPTVPFPLLLSVTGMGPRRGPLRVVDQATERGVRESALCTNSLRETLFWGTLGAGEGAPPLLPWGAAAP